MGLFWRKPAPLHLHNPIYTQHTSCFQGFTNGQPYTAYRSPDRTPRQEARKASSKPSRTPRTFRTVTKLTKTEHIFDPRKDFSVALRTSLLLRDFVPPSSTSHATPPNPSHPFPAPLAQRQHRGRPLFRVFEPRAVPERRPNGAEETGDGLGG